jgi:hypothetical protein
MPTDDFGCNLEIPLVIRTIHTTEDIKRFHIISLNI